jgi:hypothetical protein
MTIVNHLGQFRNVEMLRINTSDALEDPIYNEGYLNGIEAAKNEVWRLNGEF